MASAGTDKPKPNDNGVRPLTIWAKYYTLNNVPCAKSSRKKIVSNKSQRNGTHFYCAPAAAAAATAFLSASLHSIHSIKNKYELLSRVIFTVNYVSGKCLPQYPMPLQILQLCYTFIIIFQSCKPSLREFRTKADGLPSSAPDLIGKLFSRGLCSGNCF